LLNIVTYGVAIKLYVLGSFQEDMILGNLDSEALSQYIIAGWVI